MRYLKTFTLFENTSVLLALKDNVDSDLIGKIEKLIPTGKILEISCGNGADAIELSNLGYNVVATDFDNGYIDFVNSQGVKCIKHDTRKPFPFEDNQFDLVYSRLGLHYFTEDELQHIFKDISRITKKYLVFTVKLVNDIPTGKIIFTEDTWKDLVSNHFHIISSKVKEGTLYNNQSKWLEIVAEKI